MFYRISGQRVVVTLIGEKRGAVLIVEGEELKLLKTESLREVKNNLSRVIDSLPRTGPVLISKNGRTRAVLIPVGPDTDLESLVLSQNDRLWQLIDRSAAGVRSAALHGSKICLSKRANRFCAADLQRILPLKGHVECV